MTGTPIRDLRPLRTQLETAPGRWIWALVALGALLRFQGLGWDHGLMLHPDERNLVWAGLALSWEQPIPNFHAYNGLSVYPPRLIAELLWTAPRDADIAFVARVISASLSTLAIIAAAGIGRLLGGGLAAMGAALLTALNPGLIQWAHFGTSESALILAALVLWRLAAGFVAGERGLWVTAIASGLVLGLALGVKTSAAAFAAMPLGALLLLHPARLIFGAAALSLGLGAAALLALSITGTTGLGPAMLYALILPVALRAAGLILGRSGRNWSLALAILTALVLALAILLATTPQILAKWEAYRGTMQFEGGVVSGSVEVFWTWQFTGAPDGLFELRQLWALFDPVTALLALVALGLAYLAAIRGESAGRIALPALVFALIYAAIIFGWHAKFIRYLAPVTGILAVLAGWQLARLVRLRSRSARAAAALSAASALTMGLSFAAMYQAPDPRREAWHWLAERLEPGDVLLIEPHEVGPPFPEPQVPLIHLALLPLAEAPGEDKLILLSGRLAAGDWMLISSRRNTGVLPRLRDRFPAMCSYYAALFAGDLGYAPVARFRRRGPLLGFWEPADFAEETFAVFDHPRPLILRRIERIPPETLARRIAATPCPPGGIRQPAP